MKDYGSSLTGREFGKDSFLATYKKYNLPVELDFLDVSSIGSSFADEFVAEFAKLQDSKIVILNSNRVVKQCLNDVAEEKLLTIIYKAN